MTDTIEASGLVKRYGDVTALETLPAGPVRRIVLELVADIGALTVRVNSLEKKLKALVQAQAPQLLEVQGCGVLTATKLVRETANSQRFRSKTPDPGRPTTSADGPKETTEALRALKRRLARVVFHLLQPTDTTAAGCPQLAA